MEENLTERKESLVSKGTVESLGLRFSQFYLCEEQIFSKVRYLNGLCQGSLLLIGLCPND